MNGMDTKGQWKLMNEIKLKTSMDVADIVSVLVKNNYTCTSFAKYKSFPEESTIDYFIVTYYEKQKAGEQNE